MKTITTKDWIDLINENKQLHTQLAKANDYTAELEVRKEALEESLNGCTEKVLSLSGKLSKANERAERCEKIFSEAPDLTFDEVQSMFSDELNKFAIEKKLKALDDLLEEIQCSAVVPNRYEQFQEPYLEGVKHCIKFIECQSEQLRKEQE